MRSSSCPAAWVPSTSFSRSGRPRCSACTPSRSSCSTSTGSSPACWTGSRPWYSRVSSARPPWSRWSSRHPYRRRWTRSTAVVPPWSDSCVSYRLLRAPASSAAPAALDPPQRAVVEHREGALLVMGGPGTGKTTTLVEAVAARVGEGVPPDRILALTFGRRMAGRLRDRVEARVARRASAEPLVRTFHAYAFGILRPVAAEFGDPAPRLLTAPAPDLIIRELVVAERG